MNKHLWRAGALLVAAAFCALGITFAPQGGITVQESSNLTGNVGSNVVEIDLGTAGSGLEKFAPDYVFEGTGLHNPNPNIDWVHDTNANTDTPTLNGSPTGASGVATGMIEQVTGTGKVGHWNGIRVVDRFNKDEQDIFIKGGKENKPNEWQIGPSVTGAGKYELTQAYVAANFSDGNNPQIYLASEKQTPNGTVGYVFEFDKNAPQAGYYIPNRSNGDVRISYEITGNPNTGPGGGNNVDITVQVWSESVSDWVDPSAGQVSQVFAKENVIAIPAPPWGFVSDKSVWVGPNGTGANKVTLFPAFQFAEAAVSGDLLKTLECGAWVQVRTRASRTDGSDLKDTTKFFPLIFQPHADLTLSTDCATLTSPPTVSYNASGSHDSAGGTSQLTKFHWDFTGSGLSGNGITQDPANPNHYTADFATDATRTLTVGNVSVPVTATLTVTEGAHCTDTNGPLTIRTFSPVTASASADTPCAVVGTPLSFTFSSVVSGGLPPYSYLWSIKRNGTEVGTSVKQNDSFTGVAGHYKVDLSAHDTADTSSDPRVHPKPACPATASAELDVPNPMNPSIAKTAHSVNDRSATLTLTIDPDGLPTPITVTKSWQKRVHGTSTWLDAGGDVSQITYSGFATDNPNPQVVSFDAFGYHYEAKLFEEDFRAITKRTVNGKLCQEVSPPLTVSRLDAIDPTK